MAWLGTWAHRIEITVSNTNIDSNQTHFPLLVKLGTSVGTGNDDVSAIFDELTSDANNTKIAVTEDDGTTEVKVEIAEWDDASERAVLWVSSSGLTLSSSADTTLYIYYDSTQSANTTNVGGIGSTPGEAVWDSDFIFVHHGVTASPVDSTSGDNDGTATGTTTILDGPIGTAMDFDGINDYVNTTWPSPAPTDAHTIEMWVDPDSTSGGTPISAWKDGENFGLATDAQWWSGSGGANWFDVPTGLTTGWNQVAFSHAAGTAAMESWRNGASEDTAHSYATAWVTPTNGVMTYGRDNRINTNYMGGAICEVRLHKVKRSAAWMKANYHSTNDNLVSFGTEEDAPTTRPQGPLGHPFFGPFGGPI